MDIDHLCFSPCGEALKIARIFYAALGGAFFDLTDASVRKQYDRSSSLLILTVPVYSAQIPKPMISVLRQLKTRYIVINICFGQMVYGSVLNQIVKLLPSATVIGITITPTQHCYTNTTVEIDFSRYDELIAKIKRNDFSEVIVPKHRAAFGARFFESARTRINYRISRDASLCTNCQLCITGCPVSAISSRYIISANCIACSRCEKLCPTHAISSKKSLFLQLYLRKKSDNTTLVIL